MARLTDGSKGSWDPDEDLAELVAAAGETEGLPPKLALVWLALGGIIYTLGAVIYILKKPDFVPGIFGFHELWHLFVILAALAHYIAIAGYIA